MPDPVAPMLFRVGDLPALLDTVVAARHQLADRRQIQPALHPQSVAARSDLLAALEAYVGALGLTGRPVPYRLRDELFLYRRISGSRMY